MISLRVLIYKTSSVSIVMHCGFKLTFSFMCIKAHLQAKQNNNDK